MKTIFPFLKPYRWQCIIILIVTPADVGGSLLIPTITANMINSAVSGKAFSDILRQGAVMLVIALLSGALTLLGSRLLYKNSSERLRHSADERR